MNNSLVTIAIVDNANGVRDVEVVLGEVSESFVDGLFDGYRDGRISGFEIREGHINGGDSVITYTHNG